MKILYFHQHFTTKQGSTGTRSYQMARALVERGHHVTLVCGQHSMGKTGLDGPFEHGRRQGMVDGIEIIEFAIAYSNYQDFVSRAKKFVSFAARAVEVALRHDYDVLIATTTPLTIALPGIAAKTLRRKPFVFEVRDLWPELPKAMGVITNPAILQAMAALEWTAYHTADACIALSPGIAEGIMKQGIEPPKIVTIPNGCDLDDFRPDLTPWLPEGVQKTDFLALFAGAHGYANGLDAVLDAAAQLKLRQRNDIKILLVGEGVKKAPLQERARAEGLDNVLFFDPIPKVKLAQMMAGVDVGLMVLSNVPAFYYGTSPNKFFDYISAGLPVLNNYPGWLHELIDQHQCGIAVPPQDAVAFADALIEMADHPKRARQMGTNARALAESHFNRADLARQFCDWVEAQK